MFRIVSGSTSPVPTYVADAIDDLPKIRKEQYDSNMIGISAIVLAGQGAGTYVLTGAKEWIPYNNCGGCSGGGGSTPAPIDPSTIIKDGVVGTDSVWSSAKTKEVIAQELISIIDDENVAQTTTYSSSKIQQLFQNIDVNFDLICGGDAEALPLTPDGLEDSENKGW